MSKPATYEFGPFRLSLPERQLRRDGELIPLQHKTFETLLLLVENSGRVVEKEEFLKTVWHDSFVEEGSLTVNISLLRKSLGDGHNNQKYIETIPRRGYRFIAPVQEVLIIPPETNECGTQSSLRHFSRLTQTFGLAALPVIAKRQGRAPGSIRSQEFNKRGAFLLLAVLIMVAALTCYFWPARSRTIAVLPFTNLRPDPESDFLSCSLAEVIMTRLGSASVPNLRLISPVYQQSHQTFKPEQLATPLNADLFLDGHYLLNAGRLQLTVRLTDAASRSLEWQETFEFQDEALPRLLQEVAPQVISALSLKLSPAPTKRPDASLPGFK